MPPVSLRSTPRNQVSLRSTPRNQHPALSLSLPLNSNPSSQPLPPSPLSSPPLPSPFTPCSNTEHRKSNGRVSISGTRPFSHATEVRLICRKLGLLHSVVFLSFVISGKGYLPKTYLLIASAVVAAISLTRGAGITTLNVTWIVVTSGVTAVTICPALNTCFAAISPMNVVTVSYPTTPRSMYFNRFILTLVFSCICPGEDG